MSLTEETIEDKIEVVGDYRLVQVRTATVIKKDGVELTRSFHRHVVNPTDDTSGQSDEVKAILFNPNLILPVDFFINSKFSPVKS